MNAPETANQFPAMLDKFKGEIARALPKHLNPDRMSRIALTAFRRTPALGNCDPRSVFAAVIQASQLGLEPDTLGRAYLIPYGRECQFVPGWKGLVDLANRSGNCTVWTGAVFPGDEFDYALGDRPFITHKPAGDEGEIEYAYAVGRVKGAEWPVIEVWTASRIKKHLARYNKVGKRHYANDNFEMYARKVVLLQVLKYMPMSPELAQAVALNDAAEIGAQHLSVKDAIDGTWAPVPESEQPQQEYRAPYPADQFAKELPGWQKLIASGKKTADQIITMAESKYPLSDDQKAAIRKTSAQNTDNAGHDVTYAQVEHNRTAAKDVEVLALAADLIGEVADPDERAKLTEIYKRRQGELGA